MARARFTSVPVVAPHWGWALSPEDRVARLRGDVTPVVLRALAPER